MWDGSPHNFSTVNSDKLKSEDDSQLNADWETINNEKTVGLPLDEMSCLQIW